MSKQSNKPAPHKVSAHIYLIYNIKLKDNKIENLQQKLLINSPVNFCFLFGSIKQGEKLNKNNNLKRI